MIAFKHINWPHKRQENMIWKNKIIHKLGWILLANKVLNSRLNAFCFYFYFLRRLPNYKTKSTQFIDRVGSKVVNSHIDVTWRRKKKGKVYKVIITKPRNNWYNISPRERDWETKVLQLWEAFIWANWITILNKYQLRPFPASTMNWKL